MTHLRPRQITVVFDVVDTDDPEIVESQAEPHPADSYPPEETGRFRKPSAAELSAAGPPRRLALVKRPAAEIERWREKGAA